MGAFIPAFTMIRAIFTQVEFRRTPCGALEPKESLSPQQLILFLKRGIFEPAKIF
jgi:hypothetical protein